MISLGIIIPPNSLSMCIEHCHGPETGGRVAVRHGGFGLLIVKAPEKEDIVLRYRGVVNLSGKESWGFA